MMSLLSSKKQSSSNFIFKAEKKEFLDWLDSLRISRYWLDTLSTEDSYALCKEIVAVLDNFNNLDIKSKKKITDTS